VGLNTQHFALNDGYIYFSNLNNSSDQDAGLFLYRSRLDGSDKTRLSDVALTYTNGLSFWVFPEQILMIADGEYPSFRMITLTGEPISGVSEEFAAYNSIAVYGDTIYMAYSYSNEFKSGNSVLVMDKKLTWDAQNGSGINMDEPVSDMVVSDQYIFFTCQVEQQYLWRFDLNGSKLKQLTDHDVRDFQIFEDYVFYRSNSKNSFHCVVNVDGSDPAVFDYGN